MDDYEPWRRFAASTLQKLPGFLVVGEASDGLMAIEKARELRPELILLDIGLPNLNGLEAARQIHKLVPESKILFASENRDWEIVEEALRIGALGYLVKSDAAKELLPAVESILKGKQFVSATLAAHHLRHQADESLPGCPLCGDAGESLTAENLRIAGRHEVQFYSNDLQLLNRVAQFVGAALSAGNVAVVVATEPHREHLIRILQAEGFDINAAIEQGKYLALNAADMLSAFMVDGMPDPVRFLEAFGSLIQRALKTGGSRHGRVAVFGECVHILLEQGNPEAAIQMEKLGNQLVQSYDVDILCGYFLDDVQNRMQSPVIQRICMEHSAVYS